MRTTIDLPDDLFRQAKARAALDGIKLKELITRLVAVGLQQRHLAPRHTTRSPLPALPRSGRVIQAPSARELNRLLDEEESVVAQRR